MAASIAADACGRVFLFPFCGYTAVTTEQQTEQGQAVYTRPVLSLYDLIVHGFSNQFAWKCPTSRLLAMYNDHVTANHLDVGVGTGYFLDRARFPRPAPRGALLDLNQQSLDFASRRINRYRPELYRANVLQPIALPVERFDSVGLTYLLHCLPGPLAEKSIVFEHLQPLMNPGAKVFGATILTSTATRNWLASRLMGVYNRQGIFSNQHDDAASLKVALSHRFSHVTVNVVGCVALFSAKNGHSL